MRHPKKQTPKGFPATFPPKKLGGPERVRYYRTYDRARAAAAQAWADYRKHATWQRNAQIAASQSHLDSRVGKCNKTEATFIDWAARKGLSVHRGGWPDFLVQNTETGRWAGIEVKRHRFDRLRMGQVMCFEALSKAGMDVYVWSRQERTLLPWKDHVWDRPPDERGCSSDLASQKAGEQADMDRCADANQVAECRVDSVLTPPRDVLH